MPIDYNQYSRFRKSQPIMVDGVQTQGAWTQPSWLKSRPPDSLVHTYTVPSEYEGRPHMIAQEVYGVQELDWVIIAFNQARSVFNWPRSGSVIEYPDESLVIPSL